MFLVGSYRSIYRLSAVAVLLAAAVVIYLSSFQVSAAVAKASDTAAIPSTVFSNPAAIAPADRVSNNAGTNPGVPAPAVYPSNVTVAGLTGTVTKVTVSFNMTSTFPDDFDILLVGPTGARSLIISDAGGSGDPVNIAYTFDQTAAAAFPDAGTTVVPTGTYRPANYVGLATPEPGGQDNFPTPGPGLMSYPTDLNVFNGTNPNGTWSLYVVDDQVIDTNSLPGGWSIDVTAGPVVTLDANVDFDGDGRSDFSVVRDTTPALTGGNEFFRADSVREKLRIQSETPEHVVPEGPGSTIQWFANRSSNGTDMIASFGVAATDFVVPNDYDGDNKADIAVWRPGAPSVAAFHILQSTDSVVRTEVFGQSGDDPAITGDYDGDGKADVATHRCPAVGAGDGQCFFFYRGSLNNPSGNVTYVPWGFGETFDFFVNPGDFDGDGKNDFCIQRSIGGGAGQFVLQKSTGGVEYITFGFDTDVILPGDYDGDGKSDFCLRRTVSGQRHHWILTRTGATSFVQWGITGDVSTPGDYDGDGKTDLAIWRPNADPNQNFFWVRRSSNLSLQQYEYGLQSDFALAAWAVH